MDIQQEINKLLSTVVKEDASDLHLSEGRRPTLRIHGRLVPLSNYEILTHKHAEDLAFGFLSEKQKDRFIKNKEIDFSYAFGEKARFRVNIFYQRGHISVALRFIPNVIRSVEELNLPPIFKDFTRPNQGFVLIVGPSGHGKSTTLAALIDFINHTKSSHIITIEDPIEYVFEQDRCIIDQREVHQDTISFSRALRSTFREDPDVIMVGEMRDLETISTAITAAETGHLVFATLHTNNASQTIDRIIDTFPSGQQNQIRGQLSGILLGIVSQRLVPRLEGGRIPAIEVMVANSAVRNMIREKKTHQIDLVIETGSEEGMMPLNKSLAELVRGREISLENAEIYSLNPSDLRMLLQK